MNMELFMQYVTYALIAIGSLAFLVTVIVEAIKELPGLQRIQTSAVALAVSLILCLLAMAILCQYFKIVIIWYYWIAAVVVAFIVYLVATGGWERVAEMWNRTKYPKK